MKFGPAPCLRWTDVSKGDAPIAVESAFVVAVVLERIVTGEQGVDASGALHFKSGASPTETPPISFERLPLRVPHSVPAVALG